MGKCVLPIATVIRIGVKDLPPAGSRRNPLENVREKPINPLFGFIAPTRPFSNSQVPFSSVSCGDNSIYLTSELLVREEEYKRRAQPNALAHLLD
jgi:hypothetical protein